MGISQDPTLSLRTRFCEVLLKDEFIKAVQAINCLDDGQPWLTDTQLVQLFEGFSHFNTTHLLEANETFQERLFKRQIDNKKVTGEQDPVVKIIVFDHWQANRFVAINEYRIEEIAADLVQHYIHKILSSGFKAQVVCSSKQAAIHFRIPLYQFAHIQAKARERYKDDSINISGAGEKVRKLVNEHLVSLGINAKVPPVELFSSTFIQNLPAAEDKRAAASEMEHAIRTLQGE